MAPGLRSDGALVLRHDVTCEWDAEHSSPCWLVIGPWSAGLPVDVQQGVERPVLLRGFDYWPLFRDDGAIERESPYGAAHVERNPGWLPFCASIPLEHRALAARLRTATGMVLEAMAGVEGFAALLRQDAAHDRLGFAVLCLRIARPVHRRALFHLCREMVDLPRRDLLERLIGGRLSRGQLRVLASLSPDEALHVPLDEVWSLTAESAMAPLILGAPCVTASLVEDLSRLRADLLSPRLVSLMADPGLDIHGVHRLRRLDDLAWPDIRPAIRASLATARSADHAARLIARWLDKVEFRQPFPHPPIPGDEWLVPIERGEDLLREGQEMKHCVANYLDKVLAGSTYFYSWRGQERATVQLGRNGGGVWRLAEALGVGNAPLSAETIAAIRAVVEPQLNPNGRVHLATQVAGMVYYDAGRLWTMLRTGQKLILRREPGNPHDARAIEVLTREGAKLGYVPRRDNREVAAALDAGALVEAVIEARLDDYRRLEIALSWIAVPEEGEPALAA